METDTEALGRKALTKLLRDAGLKASHVSLLVNDKKSPSLDMAYRIEDLTGLPASFWRAQSRGAAMWARIQQEKK